MDTCSAQWLAKLELELLEEDATHHQLPYNHQNGSFTSETSSTYINSSPEVTTYNSNFSDDIYAHPPQNGLLSQNNVVGYWPSSGKQQNINTNSWNNNLPTDNDNNNVVMNNPNKPSSYLPSSKSNNYPSSKIISFGSHPIYSPSSTPPKLYPEGKEYASNAKRGMKRKSGSATRSPLHALEHVIAERKRREKLGEQFIALSALIPGLKKMDKTSVLGNALDYLKELQETVKKLKEQISSSTNNNQCVESAVYLKRSKLFSDDETTAHWINQVPLPEIEARISDESVLVRILCDKKSKRHTVEILNEVEKLQLTVISSNILPFGKHAIDITIVAKMDVANCLTVKDVVKHIRHALFRFQ